MNYWNNFIGHLRTILHHKKLVRHYCFKAGLYKQGIMHDWSKYSPTEFIQGVKYYQGGKRSPNYGEKIAKGYSSAWLHHKGRNRHHFEYWIDFSMDKSKGLVGNKMPVNYVAEMMMDRIAASSGYKGKDYTNSSPMEYYNREKDFIVIHPETRALLVHLLTVLSEQGEEALFAEIRVLLKKGDY